MSILHISLLCILLAVTPVLLARRLVRAGDLVLLLNTACILAVLLALAAALGLHAADIPITAASLAAAHLTFFAAALVYDFTVAPCTQDRLSSSVKGIRLRVASMCKKTLNRTLNRHAYPDTLNRPASATPVTNPFLHGPPGGLLTAFCLLLFILLFPYTHFTGIDTYKWQDLATSVRMERSLPWIVHPLSLLGFTPRAYPPAHPVLLATIQITGRLGVDGGFAVISMFTALFGLTSATMLARRFFNPGTAAAAGILYCLSPVFMRYAHWATGRGLFLAAFPVFIATLLPMPGHTSPASSSSDSRIRPIATCLRQATVMFILALLLLLAHKVALVAVPLVLLAALAAWLAPRRLSSVARIALSLPFLAAAAAMVTPSLLSGPAGIAAGIVRTGVMRFAWMLPFAVAGLWTPPPSASADGSGGAPSARSRSIFFLAALPAIPLAFERQMYGALYALPFAVILAMEGLDRLAAVLSPRRRGILLASVALATVFGGTATVIVRSRIATSRELYAAAMFLEAHDPAGPFIIHAPGIARTRIQAYVSGCPRFAVIPGENARPQWPAMPPRRTTLRAAADAWASWLRSLFRLGDTETSWYGNPRRHYHFVINGHGEPPASATLIYKRDGIAIFETSP